MRNQTAHQVLTGAAKALVSTWCADQACGLSPASQEREDSSTPAPPRRVGGGNS